MNELGEEATIPLHFRDDAWKAMRTIALCISKEDSIDSVV
jgi:hypothetical protein